jgi:hypothetical protein
MTGFKRSGALMAAVMGIAALAGVARAEQANQATPPTEGVAPAPRQSELPPTPAAEPAAAPRKPLMSLMDAAGVGKALDDLNINIYGFIEGSYTYNFSRPTGHVNPGRVFDVEDDTLVLNQWDIAVERTVDSTKKEWDLGGKVEFMYGQDARFTHANGLFDWYNDDANRNEEFDLVQAYADLAVPVGNGLLIRAGKFVTHMGYETINPTTNPLYSHSYLFGFAIPFTHTGVMAFYNVDDKLTVMGGISRGWEQALKDNNGDAIDGLGQIKYVFDKKTTVYLNTTFGPERAGNSDDWRIVLDGIITYAATDELTFAANADFGWEDGGDPVGHTAYWYGVAGYAGYKLNDMFTVNSRVEWFNDDDGARGLGTDVYEGTLGLTITPMPNNSIGSNLKIRPEIRYDYAEAAILDGENSQFTAAIEAYFTY